MKTKKIKKSSLIRLYVTDKLPISKVCDSLGITENRLYQLLSEASIKLRNNRNKKSEKVQLIDDVSS